jgi:hypothetical protein
MDATIITSVITVCGTILGAALSFYLTKSNERKVNWQKDKINHYKVLLTAISDLAIDGTDKNDANMRFALASNTIALIAPQTVITSLMKFHDEVKFSNPNRSDKQHDELLIKLLLEIRRDIGLNVADDPSSFVFHLIGGTPPKSSLAE